MNRAFRFMVDRLLGKHLEFRVRLFNILASFGVLVSLASSVASLFLGDRPIEYVSYLLFALLSLVLIVYGTKTGQYQRCYMITIVIIFMIGFPFFFFSGGVYYGALPYFFVFAILFTIFMLEGRRAIVVSVLELILYISICVYARLFVSVKPEYLDEGSLFFESVFGFSVVSIALGVCMFLHFRLYNGQQRELRSAREAAETANEAKSLFLANMSHEIRMPIGIMLGMNEVILRETESEKIKVYVRSAENAGQQLLTLINNILDMSSIEKGKLEITEESFATAELISVLSTTGESLSYRRGLCFSVDVDDSLPRALIGDMPRIRQIVSNLLSNAAKYTEQGSITLSFSALPSQTAGEVVLRIAVADTGIGIKEDDVPRLFDVFMRGDTQGRYIEGSGLGLAIAKEYAERMGGRVTVVSEIGRGSVFAVEVTQKVSDAASIGDWMQMGGASRPHFGDTGFTAPGCDVLIVDDNAENLQLIKSLLARTLMRTDTAASGAQCLELVKKRQYEAILMDYMMPGMDGVETMRRLKEISGFDTPVIALTANVVSGIREKLLDAGFPRYLSRPVRLRDLEEALLDVLPNDRVTTGAAARVGRSLGVNLILATQKPSGVADDEIWSNTRFRLCLRVADKQDSSEMLKRPDAAFITGAGRGYFQVGNDEIFEEFQSGWSGAEYEPQIPFTDDKNAKVEYINLIGKNGVPKQKKAKKSDNIAKVTQLDAVVKYAAKIAEENSIPAIKQIWMPPLPKAIYLDELAEMPKPEGFSLVLPIGLADNPEGQNQYPVAVDFLTDGHLLICGTGGSG